MNCINKSHPEVKALSKKLNKPVTVIAAAIAVWQDDNNNLDRFPTQQELEQELQPTSISIGTNLNENTGLKLDNKSTQYPRRITGTLDMLDDVKAAKTLQDRRLKLNKEQAAKDNLLEIKQFEPKMPTDFYMGDEALRFQEEKEVFPELQGATDDQIKFFYDQVKSGNFVISCKIK